MSTRTAIIGVTTAVLFTTGSLVFVANLHRLTTTPHLYGWNWDVAVGDNFGTIPSPAVRHLSRLPYAEHISGTTLGVAEFGSTIVPGLGISGLTDDSPFPSIRSGRRPVTKDEIVVGSKTLSTIHAHIGSTVTAVIDGKSTRLHIVGVATFPALGVTRFQETDLGRGMAGLSSVFPQDPYSGGTYNYLLVQVSPGSLPTLTKTLAELGCSGAGCVISDGRPFDISGYARARNLSLTGIGVVGLALLISLGRAVITTVRRRRRDFAILKALGMTRRQVATTVGWQATAVALTAIIVGLPLGVVAGRLTWAAFANDLGVDPNAAVPASIPMLSIAAVAVGSILVAAIASVRARRTRMAVALRVG